MTSRDAARHGQLTLLEEDPHLRREDDFYETFKWQTAALLKRIPLNPNWKYLEPCAGDGAIVKMLAPAIGRSMLFGRQYSARGSVYDSQHIWSNDLVQRKWPLHSGLDATRPDTWEYIERELGGIDLVITNLPFGLAFPVIQLALAHARVAVITLLRHTWDEPTVARNAWLAAHPLTAKIVMPRAKYRGIASTESATHSWYVWVNRDLSAAEFTIWKPHDVVTIHECVRHAKAYGEDPATIAGWTAA